MDPYPRLDITLDCEGHSYISQESQPPTLSAESDLNDSLRGTLYAMSCLPLPNFQSWDGVDEDHLTTSDLT